MDIGTIISYFGLVWIHNCPTPPIKQSNIVPYTSDRKTIEAHWVLVLARNPGLNDDSVVTEKQQEVSSSNGNIEQVKKVTQPPNHQVRWKDVVEYNGTIVAMQSPSKQ